MPTPTFVPCATEAERDACRRSDVSYILQFLAHESTAARQALYWAAELVHASGGDGEACLREVLKA